MRAKTEGRLQTVSGTAVIVVLALCLMGALCGCENSYDQGFENGEKEGKVAGFVEGKKVGYDDGHRVGFDEGYAAAMAAIGGNAHPPLRSIDGTLFSSKGSSTVFWLFTTLNFISLIGAAIFLITRCNAGVVIVAKIIVAVLASYIWFRAFEPWILGASAINLAVGSTLKFVIEAVAVLFGFMLCLTFDHLYIKRKEADVWIEVVGVAFCILIALSLCILVLNRHALLAESDLKVVFHGTTALAMGGLAYTAWALLTRFVEKTRTQKG